MSVEAKNTPPPAFSIVRQDADLLLLNKARGVTIDTVMEQVRRHDY